MAVQTGDQELRFRCIEICLSPLPPHERSGLLAIPRTLCLVEDCDMVDGWSGIRETLVAEMMDALNEAPDLPTCFANSQTTPLAGLPPHAVTGQRLLENLHKGAISGEVHRVQFGLRVGALRGDIESDQRLSGAGNPRDETDRLPTFLAGASDHAIDESRSLTEVGSIAAGDIRYGMAGIQRQCRLDDSGRGLVATPHPCICIERGTLGDLKRESDALAQGHWRAAHRH